MPLDIRLIQDSERRSVNDFYNKTRNLNGPLKNNTREYSEFCWEFIHGPEREAIYAGAWETEDGKEPAIIGMQCVIIHKMISSSGKCFLAAKGEDTLIDIKALIKYKRKDILKELSILLMGECRKKGIKFMWGLNNLPATYRRLGFETPFKSYNRILVLDPIRACKNIITLRSEQTTSGKLKIAALSGLSYLYSLKKNIILSQKKNYHMNTEISDNTQLFQRAASAGTLYFMAQDKEYLKWRISENPYPVTYRSFQMFDPAGILKAQVICSIHNDVAFIEQTLFDSDLDRKVVNFLLKKIVRSLKKAAVSLVRYSGFKHNSLNKRELNLFENLGFVTTGKGEWFTFKQLSDDPVFTPEAIYLSRLYKQGRT